jgi:hypothetical protein
MLSSCETFVSYCKGARQAAGLEPHPKWSALLKVLKEIAAVN